jgi:hypothetical protein
VLEDAGEERTSDLGQVRFVRTVEERVAVPFEQRHVRVHARSPLALDRFGHERRVDPVLLGDLLHREAERHDVVRHRQSVREPQIDLVLGRRHLVMG